MDNAGGRYVTHWWLYKRICSQNSENSLKIEKIPHFFSQISKIESKNYLSLANRFNQKVILMLHYLRLTMFLMLLSLTLQAQERAENPQPWVDPHSRSGSDYKVDNVYSVEELIMDLFAGTCVTPFNIKFQGSTAGLGYFEADQTELGLPAGIMIATGNLENSIGPNNQSGAGNSFGKPGHPDLHILAGQYTFDASVIEFDFISEEPNLHFRYVFGSEEYPEYVCAAFNDVFGFFVSGPGLSGEFSNNAQNTALLPGGLPVAINTVNPGMPGAFGHQANCGQGSLDFSHYYVNNPTGSATFQYDGWTKPLDAKFTIIPGEVYKAVIAVGDAGDGIFDSGVYISVESLCGDSLFSPIASIQATYDDKNTVTLTGQAKYSYDEWAYHHDGQVTVSKTPITLKYDVPGEYEVFFTAENYCCTDTVWTTLYIDLPPYLAAVEVMAPTCADSDNGRIALDVRSSGGGLTYLWNDGSQEGPVREGLTSGNYSATITDSEGREITTQVFDLTVAPLLAEVTGIQPKKYINQPVTIHAQGGNQPYTFLWSDGGSGDKRKDLVPRQAYEVEVVDANGCTEVLQFIYRGSMEGVPPDLMVMPNPANASLRYALATDQTAPGLLRVINLYGQILHEAFVPEGDQRQLDVASWPEGIYFFHFESADSQSIQKVFIQR